MSISQTLKSAGCSEGAAEAIEFANDCMGFASSGIAIYQFASQLFGNPDEKTSEILAKLDEIGNRLNDIWPVPLRRCRQKGSPKDICDKSEAIRAYAWQKRDKRLLKHPTETELRTKRPRRIIDRSGQRRTRSRCGGIGNQYRRATILIVYPASTC